MALTHGKAPEDLHSMLQGMHEGCRHAWHRSWPPALVNPTHSPTPQTCLASRHALHLHAAGPLPSAPAPRGATYSSSCCCLPAQGPGDQRVSAAAAPLAQRAVVAQVRARLACVLGSGPAAVPCEFGSGTGGRQTAFSAVTKQPGSKSPNPGRCSPCSGREFAERARSRMSAGPHFVPRPRATAVPASGGMAAVRRRSYCR